jgi:predicted O-methyltransferase YrrM
MRLENEKLKYSETGNLYLFVFRTNICRGLRFVPGGLAMTHELAMSFRAVRNGTFLRETSQYLRSVRDAFSFHAPEKLSPEEYADFFSDRSNVFHCMQVKEEIRGLAKIVGELRPASVLEVGTFRGGTLALWCRLAEASATICSVDLRGGEYGAGYPWWRGVAYKRSLPKSDQRLELIRGDSKSMAIVSRVKELFPRGIEFIFLDGDHTYEGAKADFDNYIPMLAKGGVLAMHDIAAHPNMPSVKVDRLWSEIKLRHQTAEFIADPNQGWAGIGVVRKNGD